VGQVGRSRVRISYCRVVNSAASPSSGADRNAADRNVTALGTNRATPIRIVEASNAHEVVWTDLRPADCRLTASAPGFNSLRLTETIRNGGSRSSNRCLRLISLGRRTVDPPPVPSPTLDLVPAPLKPAKAQVVANLPLAARV
jgi:hypothetical protein